MHKTRRLTLKRERLMELTSDQLDGLAGGLGLGTAVDGSVAVRGVTLRPCPTTVTDNGCTTTFRELCQVITGG